MKYFNLERYKHLIRLQAKAGRLHHTEYEELMKLEAELEEILQKR